MGAAILWWGTFLGIGLAALPITLAVFRSLPDRGYGLAKPLGLLIFGYLFWILGTIRVIPNSQAGAIGVLVILLVISGVVLYRREESLKTFFKEHWKTVLVTEIVFAAAFGVWAYIRSQTPAVAHTEQPMDFALLNGVLQSPHFPPEDPWYAGNPISYYYFGYLMSAGVTQATGFASAIAYNLSLASFAAMAASAVFSVVFNIAAGLRKTVAGQGAGLLGPIAAGLAGVVLLLFVGNLVGVLEFFHANNVGDADFWKRVSITGLDGTGGGVAWHPNDFWWWFRDTRVINSIAETGPFAGSGVDFTITEFPFFSFLLGDMHPHVMSMPFVILVVGLAYNALRSPEPLDTRWLRRRPWEAALIAAAIGALGFLNSWDAPTFLALFLAAVLLRAFHDRAAGGAVDFKSVATLMVVIAAAAVVLYVPFYALFDSQFAGITPVRFQSTGPIHLFLALGPLLAAALVLVVAWTWKEVAGLDPMDAAPPLRRRPLFWAVAIPLLPFVLWALVELGLTLGGVSHGLLDGERSIAEGFLAIGSRFGRLLPAFVVIAAGLWVLFRRASRDGAATSTAQFALLLIAFAFVLLLGAELFHIEDQFGVTLDRMNTVFKFYYQVWILLAIVGAVALYYAASRVRRSSAAAGALTLMAVLIAAGFVYVPAAAYSRAHDFTGPTTLNALTEVEQRDPWEYEAVQWLNDNAAPGTALIEAAVIDEFGQPQGGYDANVARFSQRTGVPTVIGWGGHERQWRGQPFEPIAQRGRDVDTFYRTDDPESARAILDRYGVTYVILGDLERRIYGSEVEERLASFLDPVFENERVIIYGRLVS